MKESRQARESHGGTRTRMRRMMTVVMNIIVAATIVAVMAIDTLVIAKQAGGGVIIVTARLVQRPSSGVSLLVLTQIERHPQQQDTTKEQGRPEANAVVGVVCAGQSGTEKTLHRYQAVTRSAALRHGFGQQVLELVDEDNVGVNHRRRHVFFFSTKPTMNTATNCFVVDHLSNTKVAPIRQVESLEPQTIWTIPVVDPQSFAPGESFPSKTVEHDVCATTPSSTTTTEDESESEEFSSFLETGVGQIEGLVKPVMGKILQPMLDQFLSIVGQNVGDDMPKNVAHGMLAGIPRLVVAHVTISTARNVSNLLTDSVPATVIERMVPELTNILGPELTKIIFEDATPRILEKLMHILNQEIPRKIDIEVPQAITRSLPIILTQRLTRSLTHALVPSLTNALSNNEKQEKLCEVCRTTNEFCTECHYSQESLYYLNFYSTYYSEYFSNYYADYYQEAMQKVHDVLFHPNEGRDSARSLPADNDAVQTPIGIPALLTKPAPNQGVDQGFTE